MKNISDFKKIKHRIQKIGIAIPGTLRVVYQRCGKSNCACATSAKDRHGPYYLWDRKIKGRLASKSIQKENVPLYREWIGNRMLLEALVQQLLDSGARYATGLPAYEKKREHKFTTKKNGRRKTSKN